MLYQAPSTAVSWTVYEFFKFYLNRRNSRDGGGGSGSDEFDTIKELRAAAVPRVSAASAPN